MRIIGLSAIEPSKSLEVRIRPSKRLRFHLMISVLISCFNRRDSIIQAIHSARLCRLVSEVIVVDDGSSDNSIEVIQDYVRIEQAETSVKIVSTANLGSANARNIALENATEKWLIFLDSDDVLNSQIEPLNTKSEFTNLVHSLPKVDAIKFSYDVNNDGTLFRGSEILAYFRYIYSKEYLVANQISFFPTFSQAEGFYIYDDWYFLLDFSGLKPSIVECDIPLYIYNQRPYSSVEHQKYLMQVNLEHIVFQNFRRRLQSLPKPRYSNERTVLDGLYTRAHKIVRLQGDFPPLTSRLRLSWAYLAIATCFRPQSSIKDFWRFLKLAIRSMFHFCRIKVKS